MSTDNLIKIGIPLLGGAYHVHHCAPIAFELSLDKNNKVTIYINSNKVNDLLSELSEQYPNHNVEIKLLNVSWLEKIRTLLRGRLYPRTRKLYDRYRKELSSNKVMISSSFGIEYLKKLKIYKDTKIVMCFHGAGDGPIRQEWQKYDLLLVCGKKIKDHILETHPNLDSIVKPVGYVKTEACSSLSKEELVFKNNKPTILYNPHHDLNYSSIHNHGSQVCDFFTKNPQYNLIIAPHVMIHNKNYDHLRKLINKTKKNSNIFIANKEDPRSFNMGFVKQSDLYLGDVSSQVYEFLQSPKPCVFLNPNNFNWQEDPQFLMWNMGMVVDDFRTFEKKLTYSLKNPLHYSNIQEKILDFTFIKRDGNAAKRSAQAIIETLS